MESVVEKLLKEIEELERQIAAHPFGGLFDKKRSDQLYQKLRKKRKELAKAEGSVSPGAETRAETPRASKETDRGETAAVKPKAGKPAEMRTRASGTKAKAGARGKGKTSTATKPKPKASTGGTKSPRKPGSRKAEPVTKGKAKTSRSGQTRKTTTLTKKKK